MKTTSIYNSLAKGILLVAILISQSSFSQTKDYTKELDIIFNSFKTKNYELIKPLLDSNVKISPSIPTGMNDLVIPQVIAQVPVPDSYTVLKTEDIEGNVKVTAAYNYGTGKRFQYFVFDKNGKVTDLDILHDADVKAEYADPGFIKN